jgi:hypothetical protein
MRKAGSFPATDPSGQNRKMANHGTLTGRFNAIVASPRGKQAEVWLVEPNGDEHLVRCLVLSSGVEIGGDGDTLAYLNDRYGAAAVSLTAKSVVEAV